MENPVPPARGAWAWRHSPRPARHAPDFEVFETLASPGCPICALALRSVRRYLDALAYESVNDVELREHLRASRGFCHHHAWQFLDLAADGLGTALIYGDVLGSVLAALRPEPAAVSPLRALARLGRRQPRWRTMLRRLAPRGQCPACRELEGAATRYLEVLLPRLSEPDMRRRLAAAGGLCLPHLRQALGKSTTAQATLLAGATVAGLHRLGGGAPSPEAAASLLAGAAGAVASPPPHQPRSRGPAATVPTGQSECAVCHAALAAADACLLSLADGQANADAVRLCNNHAWRLVALTPGAGGPWRRALGAAGDNLAQAIAAVSAGGDVAEWLASGLKLRPSELAQPTGSQGFSRSQAQEECPACRAEAAAELAATERLLDDPSGPCLPHLQLALTLAGADERTRELLAAEREMLLALRAELAEFVRKKDYRFAREPLGAEAGSPRRAVALVAGARGLRGVGALPAGPRPGD